MIQSKYVWILVLITGCVEFQDQPISTAETVLAFESRRLSDEGLQKFLESSLNQKVSPWPIKTWNLKNLTLAAFYYHPDLEIARIQREIAEAAQITAAQRPNPSISVSPGYVTNITAAPFNPYLLGIYPSVPVETAGKRDDRIAQARHLTKSAQLKIATTAWLVRSRLRSSLINLFASRKIETLHAEQLARQKEMLKLLEERSDFGEISQAEVRPARLSLEQSRIAWLDARQQAELARVQLADALGLPLTALSEIDLSFENLEYLPSIDHLSGAKMRRQALFNRSDVLGALADYQASQSALELEVAKQYPDLQVGPGLLVNQGEYKWNVLTIGMTLPILNQNEGPIAEAEARRKEAASRFKALEARITAEVDRTSAEARAALQKLSATESWLDTQNRQRKSVEALFHAGESDRLAVVTSHLDYVTTARAHIDALSKAQQAVGLLEDALQVPLMENNYSVSLLEKEGLGEIFLNKSPSIPLSQRGK